MDDNEAIFKHILDGPEFQATLMDMYATKLYRRARQEPMPVRWRSERGRSWGFALLYRSPDSLGLISLSGTVVAPKAELALAGNG